MGTQVAEPGRREQGIANGVRCDIAVGMPGQPRFARPEQPGEIQRPAVTERVDVRPHAYLRIHARHDDREPPGRSSSRAHPTGMRGAPETLRPAADSRSGSEDLVEQRFGLVLVGLLGQGELADQDLPGLGEHAFLPRRKTALPVPAPQIPDYLGHLVHVARGELLQVGLVPAGPVRRLLGVRGAQHLEHSLKPFLPDYVPDAHKLGIVRRNTHSQVTLVDLQYEVASILTLDRACLDLLDPSSPMVGVDDCVADLERHVARTPSAEAMLPRRTWAISRPWQQTRRSMAQFRTRKLPGAPLRRQCPLGGASRLAPQPSVPGPAPCPSRRLAPRSLA